MIDSEFQYEFGASNPTLSRGSTKNFWTLPSEARLCGVVVLEGKHAGKQTDRQGSSRSVSIPV
jgi:hypothetical protein